MTTIWILVAVFAISDSQIQTQYVQKFSTSTACERAAQASMQGTEVSVGSQEKKFECIKFKR